MNHDQRGTVLLSRTTVRKLTTESSTSRFALVTLTLIVAGIVALAFGGWLASVAVISRIEALLAGSVSFSQFGFFGLFAGVFMGTIGSLSAVIGGLITFQTTLCLLWQRGETHTKQDLRREMGHERRGSGAEEG
jgi:ABC-type multidrug transport system fused ATPase/permease subunit